MCACVCMKSLCLVFIIEQCTVTPEESVTCNVDKVDMRMCLFAVHLLTLTASSLFRPYVREKAMF